MSRILLLCTAIIALCCALGWRLIDLPVLLSLEERLTNPLGLNLGFILAYALANLLILPATVFNLASGSMFGIGWGLAIASVSCWLSAVIGYAIARRLGQEWFRQKFSHRWEQIEANLSQGGLGYVILARILPVIPYGIVSFTAGFAGVRARDFILGTVIGTPLGLAPFVILGYGGKELLVSRDVLPLWIAIALMLILGIVSIWYRYRTNPKAQ